MFLLFVILDLRVQARDALQTAEVNVYMRIVGCGGRPRRDTASADCDCEGLQMIREVGEDKAVLRADLGWEGLASL